MSGIPKEAWVRVAEDDVKPGMTVRAVAPCGDVVGPFIVLRVVRSSGSHWVGATASNAQCPAQWAWETTLYRVPVCLCHVHDRGGHLERLRDLDDAAEEGRRIGCDIDDRRRMAVRSRIWPPVRSEP